MKIQSNEPQTHSEEEILLDDNTTIISKTNDKGIIQYTNEDFIKISGFSEKELIGKPHNIVRHPDVPSEIFGDLWENLKKGIPWKGIFKNKTKSGDFYWVDALVAPSFDENGNILGYISVRKKPTRKQIEQAEKLFLNIKKGLKYKNQKFNFKNLIYYLNIKNRLLFLNIIFTTLMIGWFAISLIQNRNDYTFNREKIIGSDYLLLFANFTQNISNHRAMSTIVLSGDRSYLEKISEKEDEIDNIVNQIGNLNSKYDNQYLPIQVWKQLESDWNSIKKNYRKVSVQENLKLHSTLINNCLSMNYEISDSTRLILDLSPKTTYIKLSVTEILPFMLESLGQLKVTSAMAFSKGVYTNSERLKIKGYSSEIALYSNQFSEAFDYIKRNNPDLDESLIQKYESLKSNTDQLLQLIDSKLIEPEKVKDIPAFKEMSSLNNSYIEINQTLHSILNKKLNEKMFELKIKIYLITVFFILFIAIFFLLIRTIVNSIQDSVNNSIADSLDHFKKLNR